MKHLLIDGTTISCQTDGLSQYILQVLLHWECASDYTYTLLVRPQACPKAYLQLLQEKGFHIEEVHIAPIGPLRDIQFAYYLFTHRQFDAAFIPSNQYPLALRLPTIYTIHDLIYEQFPEQLGRWKKLKRWYLRWVTHVGLKRARQVVAVSQYTRNAIVRHHGKQFADKIQVIAEGWEHLLSYPNDTLTLPAKLPFKQYILYVGSSREHKNWGRLIQAIQCCYPLLPEDWGFVFIGNTTMLSSKYQRAIDHINRQRPIIQLTGWLDDQSLANYYRHAQALIFPSLSEGFGLPVLEAYFYRLPLLLSNQTALPEVAGDAAIYFDPYDVEDMAKTIIDFVHTPNHDALIQRQTQQLEKYSWKKTTQQIMALLYLL